MAGAQAQPCSSFIMAGPSRQQSRIEGTFEPGRRGRKDNAHGGRRKGIGRTGSLGSTCMLLFIQNNPVLSFRPPNCTNKLRDLQNYLRGKPTRI